MKKHEEQSFRPKPGISKSERLRKKRRKAIQKILASAIILIIAIGLIAFASTSEFLKEFIENKGRFPSSSSEETPVDELTPTLSPIPDLTSKVSISFAGDIIMHDSLIEGGLGTSGTYNYNYMFERIKNILEEFDFSIANYEGVLYGAPYSGYPDFNAPDSIANAIAQAGIDMVSTANNAAYGKGMGGLTRTPGIFKGQGVKVTGTRATPQENKFELVDINGISFAFSAYTYETVGTEEQRAINGIPMHENAYALIDSFNPYRDERFMQDKVEMGQRVRQMKESGAEVIVFIMHWGDSYSSFSNYWQQELAGLLADEGVDIIFGTHPNVIQEISVVKSAKSGKSTLVYYSAGNFISNMTYDSNFPNSRGKVEDGIIAVVEVNRSEEGIISVTKGEYISTYTFKDDSQGKRKHVIIPAKAALNDSEIYGIKGFTRPVEDSYNRTDELLKPFSGVREGILIGEYKN